MKYFVLGAFSSAFFLYGIALVYGATGRTNLVAHRRSSPPTSCSRTAMLLTGIALLLVGLGFKVAAVPFHIVDARRVPGRADAGLRRSWRRRQGGRLRRLAAGLHRGVRIYPLDWQPIVCALAVLTLRRRLGARDRADRREAHAGVLVDQPRRVHPRRRRGGQPRARKAALFYLLAYTFMVDRQFGDRHARRPPATSRHVARRLPGPGPSPARRWRSRSRCCCSPRPACRSPTGFFAKFYVIQAAVEARVLRAGGHRDGVGGDRGVPLPAHHRVDVHVGARGRRRRPAGPQGAEPPRRPGWSSRWRSRSSSGSCPAAPRLRWRLGARPRRQPVTTRPDSRVSGLRRHPRRDGRRVRPTTSTRSTSLTNGVTSRRFATPRPALGCRTEPRYPSRVPQLNPGALVLERALLGALTVKLRGRALPP